MERYGFWLWPERGEQLIRELDQQEVDFKVEFHLFVDKTVSGGWSREERFETLDGRWETYGIPVRLGDSRKAMMTRAVDGDDYCYLGLTRESNPRERVYELACKAHGLNNPRRGP